MLLVSTTCMSQLTVTAVIKLGAYVAKIDLKSAYRHVPIQPSNNKATGLQWTFTNANTLNT